MTSRARVADSIGSPRIFKKAIEHLRASDSKLAEVIDELERIEFAPEGEMFPSLVESILTQQLAWAAASAIIGRVKALYPGGTITGEGLYTTPVGKLRKAGVSPQKIRYLK